MTAPHITTEQLLQHQDWLFRLVRSLVRDDFTADDMVQATMTEALVDPKAGSSNLRGWLGTTARHMAANHWRSSSRIKEREQKVAVSDQVIMDHSADLTELGNVTNRALYDLPENERVTVMLRHMQGYKAREVAAKLNLPIEQVYRNTESGLNKLRQRLEKQYGKDWQLSCMAILAFPRAETSTLSLSSFPLFAAAAAGIAAVVGGLLYFDLVPLRPSLLSQPLATKTTSVSSDFASDESPPELLTPPSRTNNEKTAVASNLLRYFVADQGGNPVQDAKVTVWWDDYTKTGKDRVSNNTDRNGSVTLAPSAGAIPLNIGVEAQNLFYRSVGMVAPSEHGVATLNLTRGKIPVQFQASKSLAGVILSVSSFPNGGSQCITNESGLAELLFPAPGEYHLQVRGPLSTGRIINFFVTDSGTTAPILVPLRSSAPCTLIATDQKSGQPLEGAKFSLHHKWICQSVPDYALTFHNGVLDFPGFAENHGKDSIHIEADGFQDVYVEIDTNLPLPQKVLLRRIQEVPAILHLSDPDRKIVKLEMISSGRVVELNVASRINQWPTTWKGKRRETLACLSNGEFQLPRVIEAGGSPFRLTAIDDIGQQWSTETLSAEDYIDSVSEFFASKAPEQKVAMVFTGGIPPSMESDYRASVGGRDVRYFGQPTLDEHSSIQVGVLPGERFWFTYRDSTREVLFDTICEEIWGSTSFHCQLPKETETLSGRLLDPLGNPWSYTLGTARLLNGLPVSGPGEPNPASLRYSFHVIDGIVKIDSCLPGEYELHFSSAWYEFRPIVSTTQTFTVQPPPMRQYLLEIHNEQSNLPIRATLCQPRAKPSYYRTISNSDQDSGHLVASMLLSEDTTNIFLAADGYETIAANELVPNVVTTIWMKPGRRISIKLENLSLGVDPDASWSLDLWGDISDPRQGSIWFAKGRILVTGAPLEAFTLSERKADGEPTGRTIHIDHDDVVEVRSQ